MANAGRYLMRPRMFLSRMFDPAMLAEGGDYAGPQPVSGVVLQHAPHTYVAEQKPHVWVAVDDVR